MASDTGPTSPGDGDRWLGAQSAAARAAEDALLTTAARQQKAIEANAAQQQRNIDTHQAAAVDMVQESIPAQGPAMSPSPLTTEQATQDTPAQAIPAEDLGATAQQPVPEPDMGQAQWAMNHIDGPDFQAEGQGPSLDTMAARSAGYYDELKANYPSPASTQEEAAETENLPGHMSQSENQARRAALTSLFTESQDAGVTVDLSQQGGQGL